MKIRLNGKECITEAKTISELLEENNIKVEFVAVELNKKILKRTEFDTVKINEGDSVEVVIFVGGG
ncbi:MAG TPA: sulfur carrier protein ThiS [Nitrospirae bacterium]|nr:sulfur carrier protein ThiS [Nitrospirota bacterium]